LDQIRFKKRGELVAYAAKNPGALSAHFLMGIYNKLSKGTVQNSKELRDVNVSAWAGGTLPGLSDVRDVREVQTLALVMDSISKDEISTAMDIISQRILAVQAAKATKGGTWDKAENLELLGVSSKSLLAGGMTGLTV